MSDPRLGPLRAEFKELTGKNPSPRLNADALALKLEEEKAARAAPKQPEGAEDGQGDDQPEGGEGGQEGAEEGAGGAEADNAGQDGADGGQAPAEAPKAPEAAAPKPKGRGKAKADEAIEAPVGCVYLRHPEGIGASYAGVELAPDEDGRVLAPAEAAGDLAAHGFEAL
jgi:hypothetical protein